MSIEVLGEASLTYFQQMNNFKIINVTKLTNLHTQRWKSLI